MIIIVNTAIILYTILSLLGPMPPSGRRTYTGSSGQDTVWGGYVTDAGSQLTFEIGEGGRAGITQKRYTRGVTTDLLDV